MNRLDRIKNQITVRESEGTAATSTLRDLQWLVSVIDKQYEILDKLPKCWRLTSGKLVQECPVVPGMKVYREPSGTMREYTVLAVSVDRITARLNGAGCVFDPSDCANSHNAAKALAELGNDA